MWGNVLDVDNLWREMCEKGRGRGGGVSRKQHARVLNKTHVVDPVPVVVHKVGTSNHDPQPSRLVKYLVRQIVSIA